MTENSISPLGPQPALRQDNDAAIGIEKRILAVQNAFITYLTPTQGRGEAARLAVCLADSCRKVVESSYVAPSMGRDPLLMPWAAGQVFSGLSLDTRYALLYSFLTEDPAARDRSPVLAETCACCEDARDHRVRPCGGLLDAHEAEKSYQAEALYNSYRSFSGLSPAVVLAVVAVPALLAAVAGLVTGLSSLYYAAAALVALPLAVSGVVRAAEPLVARRTAPAREAGRKNAELVAYAEAQLTPFLRDPHRAAAKAMAHFIAEPPASALAS